MSYFPSRRRKKHTLPRTVNPQSALPRCNTPVIYTENGRCAPQARTQISACQKQRAAIAEPTIGSNANEKEFPVRSLMLLLLSPCLQFALDLHFLRLKLKWGERLLVLILHGYAFC